MRVHFNRLRCKQLGVSGEITEIDLETLWAFQSGACLYTGRNITPQTAHLDHITPLDRGGTNTIDNVAFVTAWANCSKSNLTLKEWCDRKSLSYEWMCAGISDLHYELGLPRSFYNDENS